jgi:transporter family protein
MSFIFLAAGSALFLGLYDLAKKRSLDHNAVWPVLFFCTVTGATLVLVPLLASTFAPDFAQHCGLWIPPLGLHDHIRLALKALIVSFSWAFTYQALKHLPMSVAAPIRASAPLFTLLAAISFLGERPSMLQSIGIAVTIGSYWVFALAGRAGGAPLHRDKWVGLMLIGTLFGAASSLYDKHLLQTLGLGPNTVQAWFSLYMLLIQGFWVLLFWIPTRRQGTPFQWRWSIVLVGVLLIAADQMYFRALSDPSALISVVSVIRRSSVVISFALGIYVLKESPRPAKFLGVAGILLGLVLISL